MQAAILSLGIIMLIMHKLMNPNGNSIVFVNLTLLYKFEFKLSAVLVGCFSYSLTQCIDFGFFKDLALCKTT